MSLSSMEFILAMQNSILALNNGHFCNLLMKTYFDLRNTDLESYIAKILKGPERNMTLDLESSMIQKHLVYTYTNALEEINISTLQNNEYDEYNIGIFKTEREIDRQIR